MDEDLHRRRLHTLKGLAATLGIDALAQAMAAAEPQAADPDHPQVLQAFEAADALQPALGRLHRALCAEAECQPEPAEAGVPAGADWRLALHPLLDCLAQNDAQALDLLPPLRASLGATRYAALAAEVEAFDFPAAHARISAWLAEP